MKKTTFIIFAIFLVSLALNAYFIKSNNDKREQIQVLENNQNSLLQEKKTFKTENGELVQKNIQLQLTVDELKELNIVNESKLKELDVKYKNLQYYVDVELKSSQHVQVPINDTLIVRDTILYRAKRFNYDNYWYTCDGIVYSDSVDLSLRCRHKILTMSEVKYKGWWIFKKPKRVETTIYVSNPTDTIVKSIVIDVIKKNKDRKIYD